MNLKNEFIKDRNIVYELSRKNVKTQYRNSVFGMLWSVLNPLLNMLVMWVVFSQFFGRGDQYYSIYLLTGNILFLALRSSTEISMTSLVNNRHLLLRIKIKPQLFPLSSVISSLVNFLFSFLSLLIIMLGILIFGGGNLFGYQLLFVIVMFPAFILFCYGIGLFLSALYVFFRDIKYFYHVFLTLWMYATPIFYKISSFSESSLAFKIIKLNPMYYFVKYFRESVYSIRALGLNWLPTWQTLVLLYVLGIISFIIGSLVFKGLKNNFMTHI